VCFCLSVSLSWIECCFLLWAPAASFFWRPRRFVCPGVFTSFAGEKETYKSDSIGRRRRTRRRTRREFELIPSRQFLFHSSVYLIELDPIQWKFISNPSFSPISLSNLNWNHSSESNSSFQSNWSSIWTGNQISLYRASTFKQLSNVTKSEPVLTIVKLTLFTAPSLWHSILNFWLNVWLIHQLNRFPKNRKLLRAKPDASHSHLSSKGQRITSTKH